MSYLVTGAGSVSLQAALSASVLCTVLRSRGYGLPCATSSEAPIRKPARLRALAMVMLPDRSSDNEPASLLAPSLIRDLLTSMMAGTLVLTLSDKACCVRP